MCANGTLYRSCRHVKKCNPVHCTEAGIEGLKQNAWLRLTVLFIFRTDTAKSEMSFAFLISIFRRNSVALEERRNVINEKLAKKEKKKKKKREKHHRERESEGSSSAELTPDSCSSTTEYTPDSSSRNSSRRPSKMADGETAEVIELTANGSEEPSKKSPEDVVAEIAEQDAREKKEREERKKNREPPIVYKDAIDVSRLYLDFVQLWLDCNRVLPQIQILVIFHIFGGNTDIQ
jgi:hypothetical protein